MSTAIIYFSIFSITSFLMKLIPEETDNRLWKRLIRGVSVLVVLAIPAFFSGIRYGIGTDYYSYVRIFENVNNNFSNEPRIEIGYKLLNVIIGRLGGNTQTLFFIIAILTFLSVYLLLYSYKDVLSVEVGMLVFFLLYYSISFNTVRSTLAYAILLHSFKYAKENSVWKFMVTVLLAASFHNSSLVVIPFMFLYKYFGAVRKLYRAVLYIVILLAMINYQPILQFVSLSILQTDYYLSYIQPTEVSFGVGLIISHAPFFIPGLYYYDELSRRNSSFKMYCYLFIIGFIFRHISYFGGGYLNRISEPFLMVLVWLVPYYYSFFKTKLEIYWMGNVLVLWTTIYWYYYYIYLGFNGTVPYITIFK